jgi:predicted nuclease with TOPRIM domain
MEVKPMSMKGKTQNASAERLTRPRKAESLERLRGRVEAAADEIVRLRSENARMSSNIAKLRSTVTKTSKQPGIVFDERPDVLRAKVRGFIDTIDEYLQTEN